MPTYVYECSACSKRFDIFQSMKDDPLTKCPECKGKIKRIIQGGMGIIFKGSGFYSTDNKRSSATTGESSKSSTAKDEKAKDEKPKDEKPKDEKPKVENSGADTKAPKDEKKSA